MAYGTVNADVIGTSVSGSNLGAGNASIMKNRIINGAMVIDQRNAGASVTPTGGSTFWCTDRFRLTYSQNSKYSGQQVSDAPTGFVNSLKITSLSAYSSPVADDYFSVSHRIEGYNAADLMFGSANAKTVTLSFWVKSSLTGSFGGALANNGFTRAYPFSYTISSANTWQQISITIAGDTTGTWNTTNGIGLAINFALCYGTTYGNGTAGAWVNGDIESVAGSVNVLGTNGATWQFTGVQLEVGSSATGFEYRQYGTELALCQRYYAKFNSLNGNYVGFSGGYIDTTTAAFCYIQYPVVMRTYPTITQYAVDVYSVSPYPVTSIGTGYYGGQNAAVNFNTAGTMTVGRGCVLIGHNDANAYLALSAEL